MANDKITRRLGSELEFDSCKEKDLVDVIDRLASSKKLGHLVSHLLRLAFESPEVYGNGQEVRQLVDKMQSYGMSPTRYNYFTQITKDMEAIKKRVDEIYNMAYKTYMLAEMGKRIGLSDKSDNNLRAVFLLERQIESICMTLGVDNLNHSFVSNKIENTHKRAQEVLEYIIESYDGIITELRSSMVATIQQENKQIESKPSLEEFKAVIEKDIPDLVEKPTNEYSKKTEHKETEKGAVEKIEAPSEDIANSFMDWFNAD